MQTIITSKALRKCVVILAHVITKNGREKKNCSKNYVLFRINYIHIPTKYFQERSSLLTYALHQVSSSMHTKLPSIFSITFHLNPSKSSEVEKRYAKIGLEALSRKDVWRNERGRSIIKEPHLFLPNYRRTNEEKRYSLSL